MKIQYCSLLRQNVLLCVLLAENSLFDPFYCFILSVVYMCYVMISGQTLFALSCVITTCTEVWKWRIQSQKLQKHCHHLRQWFHQILFRQKHTDQAAFRWLDVGLGPKARRSLCWLTISMWSCAAIVTSSINTVYLFYSTYHICYCWTS